MSVPKTNKSAGNLFNGSRTTTGAGDTFDLEYQNSTFQAVANGTSGAFSATVKVQVSNDKVNWEDGIVFTLSGTATTAASDGDVMSASWKHVRGNITAISGTGAFVILIMGV